MKKELAKFDKVASLQGMLEPQQSKCCDAERKGSNSSASQDLEADDSPT
jgi:hypothetical protein